MIFVGAGYLIVQKIMNKPVVILSKTKMSYHANIIKDTQENENFRRVLFTGDNSQLVVMSIPQGGEVGAETHKYTEQTLFFLSGTGEGEFDGKTFPIIPGDVVVVVPGTEHNFRNTGAEDLKIYTVYAPANHIDGRVHKTKADADADIADEAVGENKPICN
jgi:mannose-6-phosphate isomerase-like protein (cupin superfamily)